LPELHNRRPLQGPRPFQVDLPALDFELHCLPPPIIIIITSSYHQGWQQ
jgi:hypothetical protein